MSRLIDADALADKVADLYTEGDNATEGDKVVNDVIDLIDNAPTVEERHKGAWVCFQVMNSFSQLESKFKCPFCKREFYSNYDFCVCGADMRGKGNEADTM